MLLGFKHSYQTLPNRFYDRQMPQHAPAPRLLMLNEPLLKALGLNPVEIRPLAADLFSGNLLADDSAPIALAYAGHQYAHFVPQLGDGRALLLGELCGRDGRLYDVQLKGSGQTRFSRQGDGRAAVGPMLREYLVSEAMHALGIPTTRALAVVETGEQIARQDLLPGAVLTRVAASHIRIGTFEYFAARGDTAAVRMLADYAIARHVPEFRESDQPYLDFLSWVCDRQARLMAQWMGVGFIHGVMNTDNTAISGETIDYGPCAFMDAYDPAMVFSSIDRFGRYAYANQPGIMQWNLARLAETLLPLIDDDGVAAIDRGGAVIAAFPQQFEQAWLTVMGRKLALAEVMSDDLGLVQDLLQRMADAKADFTLVFHALGREDGYDNNFAAARQLLGDTAVTAAWLSRWQARLDAEGVSTEIRIRRMQRVNPVVIPRNHQVERVLRAAEAGDMQPFFRLHHALSRPFPPLRPGDVAYLSPPGPQERVQRTFCGT